ncbi:hypothetical protein D9611_005966 [Ephemerocybe angulata]|uniref:DNase I-like protein n=1 Tax=Ephemerocybe angulata TaxID=980116 RepID=A0A8H5FLZ7_9AGAR|nr:hypothetical protein D9611_005966 [Tulosesus angulatus]
MEPCTTDPAARAFLRDLIRAQPIVTSLGTAFPSGSSAELWCQVCQCMTHPADYCPWTTLPGWHQVDFKSRPVVNGNHSRRGAGRGNHTGGGRGGGTLPFVAIGPVFKVHSAYNIILLASVPPTLHQTEPTPHNTLCMGKFDSVSNVDVALLPPLLPPPLLLLLLLLLLSLLRLSRVTPTNPMQAQQQETPEQRLHDYPPQQATQHTGTRNSGGGGRPRFVQDAPDDDPRGVDGHPTPASAEVGGSRNAASDGGRRTPRADGELADIEQVPAAAPVAGEPHLPEAETLPPHPTRRRRPKKNSRAAVRIASLNMNGGASPKTNETHLTEARADDIRARYPRLHIVNTAHPTHDSSRDGVAIILNKYTTDWADSTTKTIIEGKALLLSLACKNGRKMHMLCVYAPSGSNALNAGFWEDLDKIWHDNRNLPRLDLLLGDFNMVESREDRLPNHADTAAVVNALTKFRERHALVDGWRQENMGMRDFTFATQHVSQQNSHSRIDRIYIRPTLLDSAREWNIRTSRIPKLDHDVVSVQIAPEGTPTMGNRRQTLPQFILDDKDAFAQIAELAKSRQARIATGLQKEWALLKGDILTLGNTLARKKMANLNKNLNKWKKRRKVTLAGVAQGLLPAAESIRQLDEINAAIRRIEETKSLRMREKIAARHHLEGETNSQYDYQLNRLQRPRDTIDSLQIPHTEPPQYSELEADGRDSHPAP